MEEVKNDYKITFGPYEVELVKSQVLFRKNNSLVKAIPVKNTFGLYDLKQLAKKVAKSVNMTNKLPVDVLKANVNEALARGLKPLLKVGTTITKKVGEDALVKLSDKFDRIDDEYAGDIASHLDMAIELMQDGYPGDATKKLKQFNKACKDVLKGKTIKSAFEGVKLDEAYYVWSGTYGKDDPRKMKDLVKVKDLAASIKQSKIHQAKHGNMRAMLDREFIKEFPKAFKSLNEKRDILQGDIDESTKEWTKTIKKLAKQDQLKKISSKDKETLLKIVRLMKTANESLAGGEDPSNSITPVDIQVADESIAEVIVIPGKSYKKLRYKVKDINKFKGALVNYVKQSKLKVDLKNDGSGNFSLNGNFNPKQADKLDLIIQKTGAVLVLAESKTEKIMNESERKLRSIIREIATPLLNEEKWTIIDPRGNNVGFGMKIQANGRVKKLGGNKKGFFAIPAAASKKAKRALEKARGNFNDPKYKEAMSDLYFGESKTNENLSGYTEVVSEGKSDSDMLKLALKGIKASRVGNSAGVVYLKSLKNAWRLNPRDKKDYMDFTVDDWEEDVINFIQNKG